MKYSEAQMLNMFKALSNSTRLQIMQWLSDPQHAFAGLEQHEPHGIPGWGGACVGTIQEKAGISQSAVSSYLKTMLQAGLLEMQRQEKWTYYRINEDAVQALIRFASGWTR